ncbi:hypothetical protein PoB_004786300 [Plakobranchus ocellatus]|uniref:Uncharacterized protein n=1 Tax=Plakobranchus ocellatus TaxID=259542 RepID=A0AAV4BRC4_9GAST|nr:hypothetical protein PoB_004786300 [Plakobranchus ocellatus]
MSASHGFTQNLREHPSNRDRFRIYMSYSKGSGGSSDRAVGGYQAFRLSDTPGRQWCGGAQTRIRRAPADLRVDSLSTVPPTPPGRAGALL